LLINCENITELAVYYDVSYIFEHNKEKTLHDFVFLIMILKLYYMKKLLRLFILTAFVVSILPTVNSQSRVKSQTLRKQDINQEKNFFELQKEFNDYWGPKNVKGGYYVENGLRKKASGWKQFRRWEWFWENRIDPVTGAFPNIDMDKIYRQSKMGENGRNAAGNWQTMGPSSSTGGYAGLGRLNCVGFRTGDDPTLYAGSPSGGLWKTTDSGTNWTVLTDDNSVLGVSDVVVVAGATTASDVVYIATGDRDGGSMWSLSGDQIHDNNTIGVLKSTDGGSSWSTTALTWITSDKKTLNRLLLHPASSSTIYAAGTDGVFKTTDGGTTWPAIYTGAEFVSMEFKPADPTIMYGGTRGGKIYRSTDAGSTWTTVLTVSGGLRVQLAVTTADASLVYAVVARSGGKLEGVYKSTDSGASFTKVFDGTIAGNYILGYYCDGSVDGGQGTYDLCLAADPNAASTLFLGGVNTFKSTDGGATWASSNMWTASTTYNSCGSPVAHADKHFLAFQNGSSTLFECNDGGLYTTSDGGTSWSYLSSGMSISQLYRLGVSQSSSGNVIAGLQDNGTKTLSAGSWTDPLGGDGMECAIDPTTTSTQYGELYYGDIYRTTDSWSTSTAISSGITGSAAWVTPYILDPTTNTTMYIGFTDVWKSTNQGTSWTKISSWAGSTLRSLTVAPSNSSYIYAATQTILYKTTNGGTSWSNITGTLPVASSYITYVSVKSDDPSTIWVSFGEYNSYGVYESTDGGSTWTNISTGLPSIPVMCVIENKQNTTATELYAGTDVGVYVKVGTADWALYSSGLPNVVVTELEIYYNSGTPHLSRLRAATFGRGLWETELYAPSSSAPIAEFESDDTSPVTNQTVTFTDLTNNDPTSWSWSFSPSSLIYVGGTSSSSQNPKVEFTTTGTYQVSLYATNANGNDTETKVGYITVGSSQSYCSASSSNSYGYLSRVQLGTIDNTSGFSSGGYGDYTAQSTDLTISSANSITVTNGTNSANLDLAIWIDWNMDGDFSDTDEEILCGTDNSGEGTFTINVPSGALLGSTRMRIRSKYYGSNCSSCSTTSNGEVEDYSVNVVAASTTWTGTSSTDWATAGNWSGGIVPTSSISVIIPATPSGGVFPSIGSGTTDAQCYDLSIASGASVTISGHLSVDGTLTNSAGTSGIVIESNASTTGSLISNTDGLSATVKRYLTGGKWHLFGSPTSGSTANNLYFGGSPDVWLKSYNENNDTWTYITDVNTSLPQAGGYATWVETSNNVTATFTGTLKAVDVTLTTSTTPALAFTDASHGYNLVANPYPTALDWDQGGWTRTNIDATVYVWKDGSNYLSRNGNGQGSLTNGIIPLGQGFFVQATAASPSLTIPIYARVQSSQAYLEPDNSDYDGPPYAVFNVQKNDGNDEVWFTFCEECGDDYDYGWDAFKMFGDGLAPQLYAKYNDMELSIAAFEALTSEGKQIPLNFKAREAGEHILGLKDEKFMEDVDILLEDLKLNVIQDMHQENTYSFSAQTYENPDRFLLHFRHKVTGIDDVLQNDLFRIYSWGKSIYIKSLATKNLKNSKIQVFDIYGREILNKNGIDAEIIKIPVRLNNSYLIVKVIEEDNIVVKKVFIR
jgi:PKD repeat protein